MTLDANDPRLTAYALGELDAEEARQVEQELAELPEQEGPELEAIIDEIRQAGSLLSGAFAAEPSLSLTEAQLEELEQTDTIGQAAAYEADAAAASMELATDSDSSGLWSRPVVKVFVALAVTLLLIAVAVPTMFQSLGSGRQTEVANHLKRIGEGVEASRRGKSADPTQPSPYYLNDDTPYLPPGTEAPLADKLAAHDAALQALNASRMQRATVGHQKESRPRGQRPEDQPSELPQFGFTTQDITVDLPKLQAGRLVTGSSINSDAGLVGNLVTDETESTDAEAGAPEFGGGGIGGGGENGADFGGGFGKFGESRLGEFETGLSLVVGSNGPSTDEPLNGGQAEGQGKEQRNSDALADFDELLKAEVTLAEDESFEATLSKAPATGTVFLSRPARPGDGASERQDGQQGGKQGGQQPQSGENVDIDKMIEVLRHRIDPSGVMHSRIREIRVDKPFMRGAGTQFNEIAGPDDPFSGITQRDKLSGYINGLQAEQKVLAAQDLSEADEATVKFHEQKRRILVAKLGRLDVATRALTRKPKTWRRARATPNASRLMIGEKEELPLEGIQANVQVDGFRARVLLDYYFYNDRDRQFEGNFKLRLPNEASLYFFAFGETAYEYRPQLDGGDSDTNRDIAGAFFNINEARGAGTTPEEILKLRAGSWNAPKVARIVPREKAAHAYRETVRRKVDPALVEWSGAGIFSARVFPLAAKKLHRIVVGYDVDLTRVGNELQYSLDLPEGVSNTVVDINLAATAGSTAWVGSSQEDGPQVAPFMSNGRAYYNISKPASRRVMVKLDDAGNTLIAGRDKQTDSPMFAASLIADLPTEEADASSPQAVFLLDTSLSSNPDKFNVYLKLLEATLENNRDSLHDFAVLLFNVENHWWQPRFVKNTPENVKQLIKYAHTLSLEGATDLGAALQQAVVPDWFAIEGEAKKWDVFLLSDGALNWGQQNVHQLSAKLTGEGSQAGSLFAYNTKMAGTASGVLRHLARETGGSVFSVVRETEIPQVARAHRQRPWQLEAVEIDGGSDLLLAGRPTSIYPGQQLLLVGRGTVPSDAAVMLKLRRGEESKTVRLEIDRRVDSTLADRTYGQVAVGQMESLGDVTEDVSIAYARHFRVTGKTCSLLMLESEADYQRFNIKPEDDAFVVKSSPASSVISEALRTAATLLADPNAAFQAWLTKLEKMPGVTFEVSPALKIAINSLSAGAFDIPSGQLRSKHHSWDGIAAELKEELSGGKVDYDRLHHEAQRRLAEYGAADALRAISSLVENSPGNLVLIRDVAYSAMEWELHDQAYHLLHRVAKARPYEPQMYLAMAQALSDAGHNDLALLYYEVASAGKWDNRFQDFNHIVDVDYLHFLRQVADGKRKVQLADFAKARLDRLRDRVKLDTADLIVAVMWNTDGTDVDLHIKEPSGETCFYSNPKTKSGGQLTRDCTQGFGPELYILPKAPHGKYDIQVKYFSSDGNRASTRTKVYATIYEGWGTKHERATRRAIYLMTGKQMHQVANIGVEK